MFKERLTSLIALIFVSLVLTGCATGDNTPSPAPQSTDDTRDSTPPPAVDEPEEVSDFDDMGRPVDPRTGRLLDRTFYFDYDRATISPSDLAVLEIHAQLLNRNANKSVVIEGHCDERGTREYNLALGERRSDAVMRFLTTAGVSSRQIETVSYGEERPEDPGHDEAAWQRNRRAVLVYR